MRGIDKFKEKKRDRWVTPEELSRLATAIAQNPNLYIRAAIWLYLLTGVRREELLRAQWADVDLAHILPRNFQGSLLGNPRLDKDLQVVTVGLPSGYSIFSVLLFLPFAPRGSVRGGLDDTVRRVFRRSLSGHTPKSKIFCSSVQ